MSRQDEVQALLRLMSRSDGQPCIGCPWSAACADLELACAAFRAWVNGNRLGVLRASREPSRRMLLATMSGDD